MCSLSQKQFICAWTFCDKSTAFAGLTDVTHVFMAWVTCFSPALINNEARMVLQLGSRPPGATTWAGTERWCPSGAEAHSFAKVILSRMQQPHNTDHCYKYSGSLVRSSMGKAGCGSASPTITSASLKAAVCSGMLSTLCSCLCQILPKRQTGALKQNEVWHIDNTRRSQTTTIN